MPSMLCLSLSSSTSFLPPATYSLAIIAIAVAIKAKRNVAAAKASFTLLFSLLPSSSHCLHCATKAFSFTYVLPALPLHSSAYNYSKDY